MRSPVSTNPLGAHASSQDFASFEGSRQVILAFTPAAIISRPSCSVGMCPGRNRFDTGQASCCQARGSRWHDLRIGTFSSMI